MLTLIDSQMLNILKQRVQKITPIERIIVFGSRARGDADKESDWDVFIQLPELSSYLRKQILEIAWEISLDYGVVISIFLVSTPLLVNSPIGGNPILRVIQREGIPV